MDEQLYLNKKIVDLIPKPIVRKIQIGDVGDISSRKSSFSYSIKLPKTTRNVQILYMLGVNGNTSRKPFENIVADYIVGGIPLIKNGYVVISKTSKFYEINLYDGVIDLGQILKNKKISDLPLQDLDHVLTSQEVVESFSNTEGFIYCVADYGLGVGTTFKAEKIAPSIYTHTIFRRIFESNGLNLVGEFFTNNQEYLKEVVTPSIGYEVNDASFNSTSKGGVNTNTISNYSSSQNYIQEKRFFDLNGVSLVGAFASGNEIEFSVAGTYKLQLTVSSSSYRAYLSASFLINGIVKSSIYIEEGYNKTKIVSIVFAVQIGDIVQLRLNAYSSYPYSEENNYEPTLFEINYTVSIDGLLFLQEGGQLIKATDYIGEMDQIEFLKDVITRYGLVLSPIKNSSDYRFRRLESLLNDRVNAEDWTYKLANKEPEENYVSGYAKKNKFKYSYPEEIVVPDNDGEMIIENENASPEKTIFTSSFEIPVKSGSLLGKNIYSVPIWELKDGVVELKETPLKVMKIKRVSMTLTVKLFDEITGVSQTNEIPFLSLEKMGMSYFIGNFYKAFQSLINNYKEVVLYFNLTLIDIYNIDFFRLKFLKQTGRFYYLTSLVHSPEKLTKATLIEILEFPTNRPPNKVGSYEFNMDHDSTRKITLANLLNGYEDPEVDPAYKIKIISGFNSNLIMKNSGIVLTEETEIKVKDLDLSVFDSLGGLNGYQVIYEFAIADAGSGQYSSEIGTITVNVLAFTNNPPVAIAGADQSIEIYPQYNFPFYSVNLNGAASYDDTGDIVKWTWTIQSKPTNSVAYIQQTTSNHSGNLIIPNDSNSQGNYVLKLVVEDEFGLTDEDTMSVNVLVNFTGNLNEF